MLHRNAGVFALGIIAASVLVGNAGAQTATASAPCTMGVITYLGYVVPAQGAPFTGTVKSTFEQKLSDENSIRGTILTHQARDSSGKTMRQMASGCMRGEDGQRHQVLQVTINDPVTKTNMTWQIGADLYPKVAHVTHQQEQSRKQMTPEEMALMRKRSLMQQPPRSEFHTEDIGTKTINGVPVKGTRTTRTIPAGEEGNELQLETILESWFSQELNLTLLVIDDDPRRGKTTIEYESLAQGEPDPALFIPPADYKIEEVHPNVVATAQ